MIAAAKFFFLKISYSDLSCDYYICGIRKFSTYLQWIELTLHNYFRVICKANENESLRSIAASEVYFYRIFFLLEFYLNMLFRPDFIRFSETRLNFAENAGRISLFRTWVIPFIFLCDFRWFRRAFFSANCID